MRIIAAPLIASLGLGACFDTSSSGVPTPAPEPEVCTPTEVAPPAIEVSWTTREIPALLTWMVEIPAGTSPFERTPALSLGEVPRWDGEGFGMTEVSLLAGDGTRLETVAACPRADDASRASPCAQAAPAFFRQPRPGDRLEVQLAWAPSPSGARCHTPTVEAATRTVTLGEDAEPGRQVPAVATFGDATGTVWVGTLYQGLVGLAPDGRAVRYAGVPFSEPWSDAHEAPQTELLFDLEDAGDGALWIGGATTGVSWFDPGPDLFSRDDDRWAHVQPLTAPDSPLKELAETTVALAATPDGGLWVASLSGLHHAAADDTALRLETLAPGAFLAVAADADGTAWAGRTVEPAVLGKWQEAAEDPWPEAALLEVRRNAARELTVRPWALGVRAVTAVAAKDGRVWLGTPAGLMAVRPDAPDAKPEVVLPDLLGGLAVTGITPDAEGVWVAARSECDVTRGELLHVAIGDDGTPAVRVRLSELGFATRDFNTVTRLPDGSLLVSTVVPSLTESFGGPVISANCKPPTLEARAGANVWRVDLAANPPTARPLGMD